MKRRKLFIQSKNKYLIVVLLSIQVTSFAIHFLPALLYYLLRWETRLAGESSENTCYEYTTDLSFTTGFLQPVSFWLFWQFSYVYFQFSYLDKHPELVISQRYLVADGKKTLTKYGYKMGIHLGTLLHAIFFPFDHYFISSMTPR